MTPTLLLDINVRHNGDTTRARAMIDAIARIRDAAAVPVMLKGEIVSDAHMALPLDDYRERYWTRGDDGEWREGSEPFHEVIARKTMGLDEWEDLYRYTQARALPLVLSAYDEAGYALAADLAVGLKVASSNLTHWPLLRCAVHWCNFHSAPLFLDTGGASLGDIAKAYDICEGTVLHIAHSPPGHPAPPDAMNLRYLDTLARLCPDAAIGLSHHGETWAPILAAVARGAAFVEVAVCDDPTELDQDVALAVPLDRVVELSQAMRETYDSLGSQRPDVAARSPMQGSSASMGIVAARTLGLGDRVDLDSVRFAFPNADHHPAGGVPVRCWDEVENLSVRRFVAEGKPITWAALGRMGDEEGMREEPARAARRTPIPADDYYGTRPGGE
jgi:sialic acid synthase SpsE